MKSAYHIISVFIFFIFWSCGTEVGSNQGGFDGGGPITHNLDTAVGYCFQLSTEGISEAVELKIKQNKITGEGTRAYHASQKMYRLLVEGILEGNEAEMRIVVTNARDARESFTHLETWTITEEQLNVDKRKIEGLEGNFSFERIFCHGYENTDTTRYDSFGEFREGYAVVSKNGKFGLINKDRELTIPLAFRDLGVVREGSIVFYDEYLGLKGLMNVHGEVLVEPQYVEMMPFNDGLAAFMTEEGKWGFLDKDLKVAIKPKFNNVHFFKPDPARKAFNEGLANVQTANDKWNYINTKGEMVIAGDFIFAKPFKNGKAEVSKNNKWYVINKAGDCVENCDE